MYTHLDALFDPELLARMLSERFVKMVRHPELELDIYNYTARAQYENEWNLVTSTCRGLIVERSSGQVVARPYTKFFNVGQRPNDEIPGGPVQVTEKMDGSLGILYPTLAGYRVATRGSFTSDQALHASRVWVDRYEACAALDPRWTYLVEIVYPENRIVVDYGEMDDLVLLGAVETATGVSVPLQRARAWWPGPVVEEHPYRNLVEVLAAPQRDGREGFVVHFVESDLRVKCKHDTYVLLHRLVTDVSERRVWEALCAGEGLEHWLEGVPDELYDFVDTTRIKMLSQFESLLAEMRAHDERIRAQLGDGFTRKAYAAAVLDLTTTYPLAKGLFTLLDNNTPNDLIWEQIRPAEHVPFFQHRLDSE